MQLINSQIQKEAEHRRGLFKAAARGDVRAQEELNREYHVRIWCKSDRKAPHEGLVVKRSSR